MKTILALTITIALIIACQSENKSSKQNETQSENKKAPTIQNISGKGDEVKKKFNLQKGLAIFKTEYLEKRNFISISKFRGSLYRFEIS